MKIITYETEDDAISPDWEGNLRRILGQAGMRDLEVTRAPDELRDLLTNWNGTDDLVMLFAEYQKLDTRHTRLFISSPNQEKYKVFCESIVEHAKWGCCFSEVVAVDYSRVEDRLTTQLHETLHLFGVDDCYHPESTRALDSCDDDECLMRYGENSTTICSSVLSQLAKSDYECGDTH